MKNIDPTIDEEVLPPTRRIARRPPPDDLLPAPRRSAAFPDPKARLDSFCRRGRFSDPVDLKPLATTWAADFARQVFPQVEGEQRVRLLLASETGFLAAIEMSKCGIRHWERLLEEAKRERDAFRLK